MSSETTYPGLGMSQTTPGSLALDSALRRAKARSLSVAPAVVQAGHAKPPRGYRWSDVAVINLTGVAGWLLFTHSIGLWHLP